MPMGIAISGGFHDDIIVSISDCVISNCYGPGSKGISLTNFADGHFTISNCTIRNVENLGIHVRPHSDEIHESSTVITDTEVSNCENGMDIYKYSGSLTISGCIIRDCSAKGVEVGTFSADFDFTNNDVFNIGQEGVDIHDRYEDSGSQIEFSNNRIHHCKEGVYGELGRINHESNITFIFSFNTIAYNEFPFKVAFSNNYLFNNIFAWNARVVSSLDDDEHRGYNLFWNRWEMDYGIYRWQMFYFPSDLDMFFDPQFVSEYDLHLSENSPAIDRGNPEIEFDREPEPNGGRVNIGGYANTDEATVSSDEPVGPMLSAYPHILLFKTVWFERTDVIKVIFQNFGDQNVRIESLEISDTANFRINELEPFVLGESERYADTLMVTFDPQIEAVFREQITVTTDAGELVLLIEARSIPRPWLVEDVSGILTRENSPYVATEIRVRENDTLIIEAGVEIQFIKDIGEFECDGTLIARGTAEDSIKFTSFELEPEDRYWQGIECEGSVFLDYVVVEAVDTSICLEITPEQVEDSVRVTHSSFRDSRSTGLEIVHSGYVEAHHNIASNCGIGFVFFRIGAELGANIHHLSSVKNEDGIIVYADSGRVNWWPSDCIVAFNETAFKYSPNYIDIDMISPIQFCGVFGNQSDGNVRFEDCVFEDPLFIGSPHYLHWLSDDSPCINAGNPDADQDADGTITDLGAIPFNHDAIEPEIDPVSPEDVVFECVTGVPITFKVFGEDVENRILDYRWTIDDSSFWGGDSLLWEFAEPGDYIIRVNATNGYYWAMGVLWGVSVEQNFVMEKEYSPYEFSIRCTYPNPFNSSIQIQYEIPEAGSVQLLVYDVTGRVVFQQIEYRSQAGIFSSYISLPQCSSGQYFLVLSTSKHKQIQKITLLK